MNLEFENVTAPIDFLQGAISSTGKRPTAAAVERRQLSSAGNAFLITKQTRVEVRRALLRQ